MVTMTLGELQAASPRPEGLKRALRNEIDAGRIQVDEQGRYKIVPEKFPADLLQAIAKLQLPPL